MKPERERDQGRWSAPEYVKVDSIVVEHGRLPIDEGVVKDIMATIGGGDVSALPPVHLWRKQPGANPILAAGHNRLEAHKRSGQEVIIARVITGETPETIRAVQLVEIDENLNRRELSPALRLSLTKRRKALYEEEHPETKRGSAGGRAKAGRSAKSQNATKQAPAFIDGHAKQTGRHRATIAREISEAEKIGDTVMKKIVGTSLDKQSEITALAAMDEQERQNIIDRAVAGEKVSAAKLARDSTTRGSPKHNDPEVANLDLKESDTLGVKDEETPLQAQDPDGAVRRLSQDEAVKAKRGALVQEQDLRPRIEQVDREAHRVNEADPILLNDDCGVLGDTESAARATASPEESVIRPEITKPSPPPAVPQFVMLPDKRRFEADHQRVIVWNSSQVQTHIIIDRHQCSQVLRPGEKKEVDLPVDEIEAFRSLSAPNRGVYTYGSQTGLPLPPHPLRFIDIPEAPSKRVDDGGGRDSQGSKAK
jgi:hypothetical protein